MMNKLFISILILIISGCNSQKSISIDSPEKLKNNQFIGTVIELYKKKTDTKEVYFSIDEKKYFVKFSEGYVSKETLLKFSNQKIVIKGEIKNGEWEESSPGSLSSLETPKPARKGEYIVVNKIYK